MQPSYGDCRSRLALKLFSIHIRCGIHIIHIYAGWIHWSIQGPIHEPVRYYHTLIHDPFCSSIVDLIKNRYRNCQITSVISGEEAVDKVHMKQPQIILMDISLPGMNGIEATRKIKEICPEIKIIMLTVHESPEYESDAINAGASAYVLKRKMSVELLSVMDRLLSELFHE